MFMIALSMSVFDFADVARGLGAAADVDSALHQRGGEPDPNEGQ